MFDHLNLKRGDIIEHLGGKYRVADIRQDYYILYEWSWSQYKFAEIKKAMTRMKYRLFPKP